MESTKQSISIQDLAPAMRMALQAGQPVELTVPGRSMHPTLLDRVSTVRLVPLTHPRRGDMVFYQRDNGVYVLHRIIALTEDACFTLCGDGQWQPEPGIRRDQLLAKVSDFRRKQRWIACDKALYRLWVWFLPALRFLRHVDASLRYRLGCFLRHKTDF